MADVLCSAQGLSFAVDGRRLVDSASFDIRAGDRLFVLGPNGAGKSLLLRLCHGLIAPTAGSVVWRSDTARRAQAMVFQRPVLLRRRVLDNVAFPLLAHGMDGAVARARALDALAVAGIAELARHPARVLSGGEQQRVALARAMVTSPKLLWLDEPTANLDPAATRSIERGVDRLSEAGCTIVMTTHDLAQARRLATRIVFIHHGRILEDAPAAEFLSRPTADAARRFLAGELID
jgi:tungstate transport system ATP-binding protein